jgi:uncharacterized membrane protein YjdF
LKSLILLEALRYTSMAVGTSVTDWYAKTGVTGLIVLAMLVVPLSILMIATLLVKPRRWNVTKLFFILLFILYGGFVGGMYVLGIVLQLIM